jgi:sarcosine oxidase subunit gamma
MLDRRSALASARPYVSPVLSIAERPGFTLTQAAALDAAFEAKLAAVVGALPTRVGTAAVNGALTVMRIGPAQFWIVSPEKDDTAVKLQGQCAVTPLSHSRVRIGLAGAPARTVLAKLMPIDFHERSFGPGAFVLTGIHHTPAAVLCTGDHAFDLYVMRTFALNVWEVVSDAASEFRAS